MTPRGSVNAWQCQQCSGLIVAIHIADGVTPMFLACRGTLGPGAANAKCEGRAVSAGYPPPPLPLNIRDACRWEWREATATERKRWRRENQAMLAHVDAGGLVLAPISDEGRRLLSEVPS